MKKKDNEVIVGIFVLVGFLLLTMILLFVSRKAFFRSGYKVDVLYEYVSILNKGAPVRMAGVKVGEINDIQLYFDNTKQKTRVRAKLFIEKGVQIRENYDFSIRGTHILSEPHIEITPKPGNEPLLKEGSVLEGAELVPVEALFDIAHKILEENRGNIESSTASMKDILERIQKGSGTVGKFLTDDSLYAEMNAFAKDIKEHPWKLVRKDSGHSRKWYFLYLF